MTTEELIDYFEKKDLPTSLSLPGMRINNCRTYVDAHIFLIKEGAPLNARVSLDALEKFKKELEKEK